MANGLKANNLIAQTGISWEDRFQIDADGLTNATRKNFRVHVLGNEDGEIVQAVYTGSGALTLSEFNNLPIGSTIFCPALATPCVYLKTTATVFKLQAINT